MNLWADLLSIELKLCFAIFEKKVQYTVSKMLLIHSNHAHQKLTWAGKKNLSILLVFSNRLVIFIQIWDVVILAITFLLKQ